MGFGGIFEVLILLVIVVPFVILLSFRGLGKSKPGQPTLLTSLVFVMIGFLAILLIFSFFWRFFS